MAKLRWIGLTHYDNPVPYASLGSIGDEVQKHGAALTVLTMDDPLPPVASIDGVIVMGGAMSVHDYEQIPRMREEAEYMRRAVEEEKFVLGVCLGAQLLAFGLGERTYQGPVLEAGAAPLLLTRAGQNDPVVGHIGRSDRFVQRHADTFDLPTEAVLLASSEAYPNQAYRVGDRAYAVQFHPEMTPAVVASWHERYPDFRVFPMAELVDACRSGRTLVSRYFEFVNSLAVPESLAS